MEPPMEAPESFACRVPVPGMADIVWRYLVYGIPPGHFLTAILSDRLVETLQTADQDNMNRLVDWAVYLLGDFDERAWGSPAKVTAWIAHQGLSGLPDEEDD